MTMTLMSVTGVEMVAAAACRTVSARTPPSYEEGAAPWRTFLWMNVSFVVDGVH